MAEQFVIVVKGSGHRMSPVSFRYAATERETVDVVVEVSNWASADKDPEEVQRIFKFNEFGKVTHYNLALKGFKPFLEAIPEAAKDPR